MDSWIAAEGDMGQLESLHTCPAGEGLLALQGLSWDGSSPGHPELRASSGQAQPEPRGAAGDGTAAASKSPAAL